MTRHTPLVVAAALLAITAGCASLVAGRSVDPCSRSASPRSSMAETWIGVTGLYTTDNPHPGVAVMRALRSADPSWRIVALAWDRWGTGAYADDVVDAR